MSFQRIDGLPVFIDREIMTSPCEAGRLKMSSEQFESQGLGFYKCLDKDFNLTLQGGFSGTTSSYIRVQIDYCVQEQLDAKFPGEGKICKSKTEIE